MNHSDRIAENVASVRDRIADAARRSGRTEDAVTLVAVTKYVGAEQILPLLAAGCRVLGESRPQQLWNKADALAEESIEWHLIGHLQRNKVRRTLPITSMIQSGDSWRIFAAINDESARLDRPTPMLIEVNISGEEAKGGCAPDQVEPLLEKLAPLQHVQVQGLMAMGSWTRDLDTVRADFCAIRELRDRLQSVCPAGVSLDELSMGMSGDFEVGIEEGATIVRVGSALFEGAGP